MMLPEVGGGGGCCCCLVGVRLKRGSDRSKCGLVSARVRDGGGEEVSDGGARGGEGVLLPRAEVKSLGWEMGRPSQGSFSCST